MQYREEIAVTQNSKKTYLDGFKALIRTHQKDAEKLRDEYCTDIFIDSERYRQDFKRMLGWPLVDHITVGLPEVTSEFLTEEGDYSIYRMTFAVLEDIKITGLYFEAHGNDKKPLVLVQHGGIGTPEKIAGFYGDTSNYNDMLERVTQFGVHAFAPQLLLWGDQYEVPFKREVIDVRLKRLGSSITALELYGLGRILDYFEKQPRISTFGMVGLSYGGFYTLFLSAIDTRIRSAISCSFFNTRDKYHWIDWTWFNAANMFDDAEIACLVYPRKLCIQIGTKDELFNHEYGVKSYERLCKLCKDVGTDWVDFICFEGTHEFCKDDRPIERLIHDLSADI